MIDFNVPEIVILVVLAVFIFGPEKLPELARKAARVINYLRNIANDAQGRLREELGPEFADLELSNPKAMVTKHLLGPAQAEIDSIKAEIAPVTAELSSVKTSIDRSATSAPATETPGRRPEHSAAVAFDTEAT